MFIISVHEKCIFEYSLSTFYAFRGEKKILQDLQSQRFVLFFVVLYINKIVMGWELYVWNVNELPASNLKLSPAP